MTAGSGYRRPIAGTTIIPVLPGKPETAPAHRPGASARIAPALLTVEGAAHYLSIGRSQMFELLRRGEIPSLTIGPRGRRVRVADLDAYVQRRLAAEGATR